MLYKIYARSRRIEEIEDFEYVIVDVFNLIVDTTRLYIFHFVRSNHTRNSRSTEKRGKISNALDRARVATPQLMLVVFFRPPPPRSLGDHRFGCIVHACDEHFSTMDIICAFVVLLDVNSI